jgi:hypothetical protein
MRWHLSDSVRLHNFLVAELAQTDTHANFLIKGIPSSGGGRDFAYLVAKGFEQSVVVNCDKINMQDIDIAYIL